MYAYLHFYGKSLRPHCKLFFEDLIYTRRLLLGSMGVVPIDNQPNTHSTIVRCTLVSLSNNYLSGSEIVFSDLGNRSLPTTKSNPLL